MRATLLDRRHHRLNQVLGRALRGSSLPKFEQALGQFLSTSPDHRARRDLMARLLQSTGPIPLQMARLEYALSKGLVARPDQDDGLLLRAVVCQAWATIPLLAAAGFRIPSRQSAERKIFHNRIRRAVCWGFWPHPDLIYPEFWDQMLVGDPHLFLVDLLTDFDMERSYVLDPAHLDRLLALPITQPRALAKAFTAALTTVLSDYAWALSNQSAAPTLLATLFSARLVEPANLRLVIAAQRIPHWHGEAQWVLSRAQSIWEQRRLEKDTTYVAVGHRQPSRL